MTDDSQPIDMEKVKRADERVENADTDRTVSDAQLRATFDDEALTVEEVAEILSYAPVTIRRKLRSGELPGVKLDKEWRISRPDLQQWWSEQGGDQLFGEEE